MNSSIFIFDINPYFIYKILFIQLHWVIPYFFVFIKSTEIRKIINKKAKASVENTVASVTSTLETLAFSNSNISQFTQNVKPNVMKYQY